MTVLWILTAIYVVLFILAMVFKNDKALFLPFVYAFLSVFGVTSTLASIVPAVKKCMEDSSTQPGMLTSV